MTFFIKRNDTSPAILATLQDADDNAIDITGATVRFHLRAIGAKQVTVDSAAVIVAPLDGIVRYDWNSADTDVAGSYQAEFKVTYADASIETFPNNGYLRVEIISDIA
jgi:hypothetical protein